MARNTDPAPRRRGAAVVVRAWLGEGCSPAPWLDPGTAGSPGGAGFLGCCCWSPALHGVGCPGGCRLVPTAHACWSALSPGAVAVRGAPSVPVPPPGEN